MQKLHFTYEMRIGYAVPVERCNYTIKCFPKDNKRQIVHELKISLVPNTFYLEGYDGLLNKQIYGINEVPHYTFDFKLEGSVTVGLSDYEEDENENLDMIFKHPHGLNVAGDNIKAFLEENRPDDISDKREAALFMMHRLHETMKYEPLSTNVKTTAEEAFSMKRGVCQDYAHIFIALMHLLKIPARYVTGLIVGEGASHAWAEILSDGKWYGFDPTNDKIVADEHVKIGIGRDARDCMINRGIMHGGGPQSQEISAKVEPYEQ